MSNDLLNDLRISCVMICVINFVIHIRQLQFYAMRTNVLEAKLKELLFFHTPGCKDLACWLRLIRAEHLRIHAKDWQEQTSRHAWPQIRHFPPHLETHFCLRRMYQTHADALSRCTPPKLHQQRGQRPLKFTSNTQIYPHYANTHTH